MTTQSEQYELKLRADCYAQMLLLREICADIHEAEERCDEDMLETYMLKMLDEVPHALDAYFSVIEEGTYV